MLRHWWTLVISLVTVARALCPHAINPNMNRSISWYKLMLISYLSVLPRLTLNPLDHYLQWPQLPEVFVIDNTVKTQSPSLSVKLQKTAKHVIKGLLQEHPNWQVSYYRLYISMLVQVGAQYKVFFNIHCADSNELIDKMTFRQLTNPFHNLGNTSRKELVTQKVGFSKDRG